MGLSGGLIILGGVALFVFFTFFWLLGIFGITLDEEDFISKITPYLLFIGLIALASGIGIKVYHLKKSGT
jgi:hypothetical protein